MYYIVNMTILFLQFLGLPDYSDDRSSHLEFPSIFYDGFPEFRDEIT